MSNELLMCIGAGVLVMGMGLLTSCGKCQKPFVGRDQWADERREMVVVLRAYGIRDERLLAVMGRIPRHLFIPEGFRSHGSAYGDHPCAIGDDQTISQPYIVAYMTEKLGIKTGQKVLEIGSGSGYQAAVLAALGARVYSMEIIPALADHARTILNEQGYEAQVTVRTGDGYKGWPEAAPFDAIIVTCAPETVPEPLISQLAEGGIMIIPAGTWMSQRLIILQKKNGRIEQAGDLPVRFVPMIHSR